MFSRWISIAVAICAWSTCCPAWAIEQDAAPPPHDGQYVFRIGEPGIEVVEILDEQESVVAVIPLVDKPRALTRVGNTLYVAREQRGVTAIDVSDPRNPKELLTFAKRLVRDMSAEGTMLTLSLDQGRQLAFDISDPKEPLLIMSSAPRPSTNQVPRAVPRPAPATPRWPLGMKIGGAIIASIGTVLLGSSGVYWKRRADKEVEERRQTQQCMMRGGWFCGPILGYAFDETLAAGALSGLGMMHLVGGLIILSLGQICEDPMSDCRRRP